MKITHLVFFSCIAVLPIAAVHADTFGTGANTFTIDFVPIGNPGNGDDRAFDATNHTPAIPNDDEYASPNGGVSYIYRMGATEVAAEWVTKARTLGLVGPHTPMIWTGLQPATPMSWYQAAAFVNWLNTSTGHQAAYNLTYESLNFSMTPWSSAQAWQLGGENLYRHKDAYYFLPSEDEWYKAAYHKNDGITANYWDYATASNFLPMAVVSGTAANTAVYNFVTDQAAAVNNDGGLSAYGTRGQGGNMWEWMEDEADGTNDGSMFVRVVRGGAYDESGFYLSSAGRETAVGTQYSFRVASVIPEPSSALLLAAAGGTLLLRRRR